MAYSMNKFLVRFLLFLLVLGSLVTSFQSCKSKRVLLKKPLKEHGEGYLLEKLSENQMDFEWFSARANISYINNKNKTDFRGQLRMQKDSVIWISFSPALGLEVARLKITPDSIKFLNRLDRVFFEGDYQLLNNFLQTTVDFDILQSLLIGNDFTFYDNNSFRASIDALEYRLSTTSRTRLKRSLKQGDVPTIFIQNIWLNPESFKITRMNLKELSEDNKRLQVMYDNFVPAGSKLFPSNISFDLQADHKIILSIDFSRIELEKEQSFPFRIPDKFSKIE
jgi:hypothetical protein